MSERIVVEIGAARQARRRRAVLHARGRRSCSTEGGSATREPRRPRRRRAPAAAARGCERGARAGRPDRDRARGAARRARRCARPFEPLRPARADARGPRRPARPRHASRSTPRRRRTSTTRSRSAREGDGIRAWVHIADVSALRRRPASPLDHGAAERALSTYVPGLVAPMLPPELADDLCSLRPHVDRLCRHRRDAVRREPRRRRAASSTAR